MKFASLPTRMSPHRASELYGLLTQASSEGLQDTESHLISWRNEWLGFIDVLVLEMFDPSIQSSKEHTEFKDINQWYNQLYLYVFCFHKGFM